MTTYSVKRADLCEAGRKGWACVDAAGAPVEYFEEYKHAAERAKLENDTARMRVCKPRKSRPRRSESTVGDCDGRNFDNLGESPDY
jgi:hypothetical protein